MKKTNKRTTVTKGLCLTFMLLLAMAFSTSTQAQNVTISPSTGKLIAAVTYPNEVGFQNGWSSMWRHDQLPLTFTVADDPDLTEGGEISNPAGNISVYNGKHVIMGGQSKDLYCVISLPKGYRITSYKIVLQNNLNNQTVNNMYVTGMNKTFYETGSDFSYTNPKAQTNQMGATNSETDYVIQRTSHTATDMSNQLYFRMQRGSNAYYATTVKSIELYFTAQGDFTAPVSPFSVNTEGASFVEVPFLTSKIDVGEIKPHTKNGKTFFSYNYLNVKDLTANNLLYEQEAVENGKVAEVGAKSITSINNGGNLYFALGNHTYFVETPTEVTTQNNTTSPIHYRIVDAKVNYSRGVPAQQNNSGFQITTEKNGTTYYLNTNGKFVATSQTIWTHESGKIRSGEYYLKTVSVGSGSGSYTTVETTTSFSEATSLSIDTSNRILNGSRYLTVEDLYTPKFTTSSTYAALRKNVLQSDFSPKDYTLTVYQKDDKDGTKILQTVQVNSGNQSGSIALTGINNDAIKFAISGLPEDGKALITVDLTLEALNPYINRLNLVCQETGGNGRMLTQQFTSNDFAVSGGKFIFYVPEEFNTPCQITFRDLYSSYGDNTYYEGLTNGHARYSLVKSEYWDDNANLYSPTYNPDASYTTKIRVDVSGTHKFRFNNADELDNNNTSSGTKYYEEYPFSLSAYNTAGGDFTNVTFNNFNSGENEKICYLFTCDETRYNIAPTTASEHRYYAYYIMDILLEKKTYTPVAEWTKIYEADKTCYSDGTNGSVVKKDQWGMKLKTTEASTTDEYGYLTVGQIDNLISTKGIEKNQILYVDGSELLSIVNENTEVNGQTTDKLAVFHGGLGKNALIFLPEGTTYNRDNFAYKTMSNAFRACNNIVLTDKNPFFSPYDIQVEASQYSKYTREVALTKYQQETGSDFNATIMVPFTINLVDGVHTNKENDFAFTLNKMKETDALVYTKPVDDSAVDFMQHAVFNPINGESSDANVPYMVHVTKRPESGDAQISFIVTAYGSSIAKTPTTNTDYIFDGESATGTVNENTINFQNHATYSGRVFTRDDNQIFYFAKSRFLCIKNLRDGLDLNVYPFRGYYTYTGSNIHHIMNMFGVTYDDLGEATGITNVENRADMVVVAGKGSITVKASAPNDFTIHQVNGLNVGKASLSAGETRTFNVPAGIYVINGTKVIVK